MCIWGMCGDMKLLLIVIISLLYANANAATQCVKLAPSTVCNTTNDCYNTSDCTVECDNTMVSVVGRCSSTAGVADTSAATNISPSGTTANNIYCWCTMIAPAVSKWVLRYTYTSADNCAINCTRGCRNGFIFDNDTDRNFRTTLYSNILE